MTLDEQISFCEEKSKNIKLKTEPQTFIDIKNSLEKLKNSWIPCSDRVPEECQKSVEICKSIIERNITQENMEEYMKFEDECVSRGFTFNSLLEAREKQTAKKPEFVDTRFMNNGKHISDGCQLQKCYKCPNCNQHIFHVWDDELYCKYCGQHIDWSDEE